MFQFVFNGEETKLNNQQQLQQQQKQQLKWGIKTNRIVNFIFHTSIVQMMMSIH